MNNVVKPAAWWNDRQPPQLPPDPPEPPHMDQRVAKLEALAEKTGEQLTAINKDLAVVRSNHATREDIATLRGDVHRLINEQTWKISGATVTFGTLLVGAVFFIARNVR